MNVKFDVYVNEMLFANALSVEFDPIWSISTEFDIVVNVVMDSMSITEVVTMARSALVLAVELVIFAVLSATLDNFSKD